MPEIVPSPIDSEAQADLEFDGALGAIVPKDTPLENRVALLYGDADLGRRCIISGGEVLEI